MSESTKKTASKPKVTVEEVELLEAQAIEAEIAAKPYREDGQPHVIALVGQLVDKATSKLVQQLLEFRLRDRNRSEKTPIHFHMDLFGGDWTETFALFDIVRFMREEGHTFVGYGMGHLEQQGLAFMQALDHRMMTPSSWAAFTKHNFQKMVMNTGDAQDLIKYLHDLEQAGRNVIAARSAASASEKFPKVVTDEVFKTETGFGKDWNLTAAEAREWNLIDEVGVRDFRGSTEPFIAPADTSLPLVKRRDIAIARKLKAKTLQLNYNNRKITHSLLDNGIVVLNHGIGAGTGVTYEILLEQFHRYYPGKPLELWINSPGGAAKSGASLVDAFRKFKALGHKVTTVVFGQAASMGGFLMQVGDERIIGKNAKVLIHRVSTMFGGTSDHMEGEQKHASDLEAQLMPLLSERSTMSVKEIHDRCEHKDWWLNAEEAVKLGFADKVR